jgi:hypothetical protein
MRHIPAFITLLGACLAACGQARPAQQPSAKTQAAPTKSQPFPQTQDTDAAIQAKVMQTATATIHWDKSTSPGVKVDVQLIKKDQSNGRPLMQYRLKISGAPKNKLYNLIAWPITVPEPATIMEGLAIAADGTVGCPPNSNRSCAQRFKGAELKLTYTPLSGRFTGTRLSLRTTKAEFSLRLCPRP